MPAVFTKIRAVDNTLPDNNGSFLRKPVLTDYVRLLSVSAIWGATFLLNAVALVDFAPVAIAGYRIILAALVLCAVCLWRQVGVRLTSHTALLLLAIGLLNSVVPFSLIGWGQLHVDSATTAILLASSPFSTLLLSHFMTRDDRFSWSKLIGLIVGFVGVLVLLSQGLRQGSESFSGMVLIVLAACCYSLSSLLIRRLGAMPSLFLVATSLASGALILLPVLIWWYPPWQQTFSASSAGAMLSLAIGPTAIAYVLRAQIVQLNGAVFMSNVGYLIPLFAVGWGWLFLGQQPSLVMIVALVLILVGIAVGQKSNFSAAKKHRG